MDFDLLFSLALFALVSSITPGPNNLMLMASGANFGFWRTVPHMLGISIGFMVMMLMVGLGLIELFDRFPVIYTVLKVLSVAYLLFLAWRIANAAPVQKSDTAGRPFSFLQAAAFQWVNPKAWSMALTAITVYVGSLGTAQLLVAALFFVVINLPSVTCWTLLGQQVTRVLTNPARLKLFNWSMAALLVLSLYPVLGLGQ